MKEPLFSDADRKRIVRSFIENYLRGSVKLHLPTTEERKKHVSKELASSMEDRIFGDIINLISAACGSKDEKYATWSDEMILDSLLGYIVVLRQTDRVEGQFLEALDLQARMDSLDKRLGTFLPLFQEWMDKYGPLLNTIEEEQKSLRDGVNRLGRP